MTAVLGLKILRRVSFFALAVMCHGSCTRFSPDAGLQIQWPSEPVALNPWQAEDGAAMKVLHNTWELWVRVNPSAHSSRVEGRLASHWQWDRTGRELTVWIRDEAKWSDGVPVTAEQARAGILKTLAPETGSKMAVFFSDVRDVRVLSERVFQVRFKRKLPYGVMLLSLLGSAPLRPELQTADGAWPENAPSTGIYRLESWERGKRVQLAFNPHYWGNAPTVKRVTFEVVTDETTALHLFESGRLQVISRLPASDFKRMRARGWLRSDPWFATYYLAFRMDPPGGRTARDVRLRRELSAAIDRKGLVQALDTGDEPSAQWVPELLSARPEKRELRDPKATAFRLWGGVVDIAVDGSARNRLILEKVQQDWKKNLGIELKIHARDWKSHIRQLETDPAPVYRFGWLAPFADPVTHLLIFGSQSKHNYTRWKSAEYDALLEQVQELPLASPERARAVVRADQFLTRDAAVVIPLFHYRQSHLVHPSVGGFSVDPTGVIRLEELQWKP